MNSKKKVIIGSIIGISMLLLIFIGITYAFWKYSAYQTNKNIVNSTCFKLSMNEINSDILIDGYPMTDEDGEKLTPYSFTIQNDCSAKAKYTIKLEIDNSSTLNEQYIKTLLNTNSIIKMSDLKETTSSLNNAKKSYILEEMSINGNSVKTHEFRLWMDGGISNEDKNAMNKTFSSKITVEGTYDGTYTETILNGTDPVIKDNLIPITIDSNGTVTRADTNSEWYNYENKVWANAIILEDETKYYSVDEIIPENNIESYFVWIPRYKYQIFDNGLYNDVSTTSYVEKSQEIKVVFESNKTVATKGTKKGDWLTHPAFTSFDTNGMWVGKFETGYKGATTKESAQQNLFDSSKVQIKPNVYSWRSMQVANGHLNSYNYQRNLDSHMMKNTEWGAVSYLQHSKYGSMSSVRLNNNSSFLTGYSAVTEPTCGNTGTSDACNKYESTELNMDGTFTKKYNTTTGYLASTTSNISGVYDMSGGSWEYVMGVMSDITGKPASGKNNTQNSGFNGLFTCPTCDGQVKTELTTGIDFPSERYYDLYAYTEVENQISRRILGDATGEMGPLKTAANLTGWYQDYGWMVFHVNPWFDRGSGFLFGNSAGAFNFGFAHGNFDAVSTYRIVLAV